MDSLGLSGLVTSGEARLVGTIFDVTTGQVRWEPEANINDILKKVEADPERATDPVADARRPVEGRQD